MKRTFERTLVGLVLVALVMMGSSVGLTTSQAAPAWQAAQVSAANWGAGALVRVKASVPFVWVRVLPSVTGAIRATASSGDYLVVVSSSPVWDGVQWWWNVRWGNVVGFVEEQSMELVIQGATATATTVLPTPTPVPTSVPTATPPPSTPPFTAGNQLRIKASIAFVWLRNGPSSVAAPVDTAYSNSVLVVVAGQTSRAWDGVQWWDWVARVGAATTGWVEEARVELIPPASGPTATPTVIVVGATPTIIPSPVGTTGAPAAWAFGSIRSVKSGIPFAWMRSAPSSTAGVQFTLYPGWIVLIADATPVWDGVQWWWKVLQPARGVQGWVEQNSLF